MFKHFTNWYSLEISLVITNIMDPAYSRYNKFQRLKIIFHSSGHAWEQDSISGVATRLDTWQSVVQFLAGVEASTLALVPTHTCIRYVQDVKCLRHDRPFPPSSVKVKNEHSCTSTPLHVCTECTDKPLPFTFRYGMKFSELTQPNG